MSDTILSVKPDPNDPDRVIVWTDVKADAMGGPIGKVFMSDTIPEWAMKAARVIHRDVEPGCDVAICQPCQKEACRLAAIIARHAPDAAKLVEACEQLRIKQQETQDNPKEYFCDELCYEHISAEVSGVLSELAAWRSQQ